VSKLGVPPLELGFVLHLVEKRGQVLEDDQYFVRFFFVLFHCGLLLVQNFFALGQHFLGVGTDVFLGHLDAFVQLVTFDGGAKEVDFVEEAAPEFLGQHHVHEGVALAAARHPHKQGTAREPGEVLVSEARRNFGQVFAVVHLHLVDREWVATPVSPLKRSLAVRSTCVGTSRC